MTSCFCLDIGINPSTLSELNSIDSLHDSIELWIIANVDLLNGWSSESYTTILLSCTNCFPIYELIHSFQLVTVPIKKNLASSVFLVQTTGHRSMVVNTATKFILSKGLPLIMRFIVNQNMRSLSLHKPTCLTNLKMPLRMNDGHLSSSIRGTTLL